MLRVRNLTRQSTLADRARHAHRFVDRARGLLGHPPLQEGEALVLEPCTSVHMFFMKVGLDVIFARADGTVVAVEQLLPWQLSRIWLKARYAIELPLGAARETIAGDRLAIEELA